MLRAAIERVLLTSHRYDKNGGREMAARDSALGDIESRLADHVAELPSALSSMDLRAKRGGRQSNYSPTAWVRLYSKEHAPNAMEGYYLVYLFAADGSAVYLSLSQGTSEFRSGAMRPINNRDLLKSRASEARRLVGEWSDWPELASAQIDIDLGVAALTAVGIESRRRIHNYEDANILAFRYNAGSVPAEDVLLRDLTSLLPLLANLYKADLGPAPLLLPQHVPNSSHRGGGGNRQGRQLDHETRRSIETYAEDVFVDWLTNEGWEVKRVGSLRIGYDLDCTKDLQKLHVEVKGTVTRGEEVILTPGEVRHVTEGHCRDSHALAICSEITLAAEDETPRCSGGKRLFLSPWMPEDRHLTATEYSYLVPRGSSRRL